ncbi:MAG TPA: CaiB/BaiF CoA-transferase family protein [Solirubrobacteraceae bacterium]|nr:CaiB/BaiF CoA-transferase family protein [Solirubrobacteraceae bacterium]
MSVLPDVRPPTEPSAPEGEGPLAGLRVLELGGFIAAPFTTRLFADFGAEVIKVERPGSGDELRGWRRIRGDTSMMFRTVARNKKSLTLDLSTEQGRSILLGLLAHTDVLVENLRPGALERWNLGVEQLAEAKPDIVVVRISGYGQTGPYRDRAGFGGIAEAFGGLRAVTGYPDRPPVRSAAPVADCLAGLYGAAGALMVLLGQARRTVKPGPQVVDVALYEAVFMLMESLIPDYDAHGIVRERTGGSLLGVVPSGIYPTADDQDVMIAGNSSGAFSRLMRLIGRDDLADDPTLVDADARWKREREIEAAIRTWTSHHSVRDAVGRLADAGVPAGPIYDARAIAEDPHYAARDMLNAFELEFDGARQRVRFPGVVPRLPDAPGAVRTAGPQLGEHTDALLGELLGLDRAQIARLRDEGVI